MMPIHEKKSTMGSKGVDLIDLFDRLHEFDGFDGFDGSDGFDRSLHFYFSSRDPAITKTKHVRSGWWAQPRLPQGLLCPPGAMP